MEIGEQSEKTLCKHLILMQIYDLHLKIIDYSDLTYFYPLYYTNEYNR
jgi:hypothetical protein